ncbi:hypothetical protein RCJ22_31940 [Vibrio sp. FNV 38]|nr:hypothetical protein [Vibrio sp. FNV 38]
MKTIICNSLQSFWDMADNQLLNGQQVHCVFPVTQSLKAFIMNYQVKYQIGNITFTEAFE